MRKTKTKSLPISRFAAASIADFVALCEQSKTDEAAARYLNAAVDSARCFVMVNGSPTFSEWVSMSPVDRGALVALTAKPPAPQPTNEGKTKLPLPPGASISAGKLRRGVATPITGGIQPQGRMEP